MNAHPFGAPGANLPVPEKPTKATHDLTARAADNQVDSAWEIIRDPMATDTELRCACNIVIDHCRDPRRDTARDILAIMEGSG